MLEALPTLIFCKNGEEVERVVGSMGSEALEKYIQLILWDDKVQFECECGKHNTVKIMILNFIVSIFSSGFL